MNLHEQHLLPVAEGKLDARRHLSSQYAHKGMVDNLGIHAEGKLLFAGLRYRMYMEVFAVEYK